MLNARKSRKDVQHALDLLDAYLAAHAPILCRPVLDYLAEAGEARSASEIENHFQRDFGLECVTPVCEYLAGRGLIAKVSLPTQLTRRGQARVEELAFLHAG